MYHNVQYIRTRGVGLGEGPMVSNYVTAFSCNKGTNFDLEEHLITNVTSGMVRVTIPYMYACVGGWVGEWTKLIMPLKIKHN